ncbi:hypothetical protein KKG83_00495 [Candidatus Micrarchaeota archaeon]|nr:hypothetical protein [Candidatus Micrarchaeota archaeon]MBU2475930.1 hypothetical protein [Candidatus Micrarchaeota archaeon]
MICGADEMKKLLFLVFFVLLLSFAFSLEVGSVKGTYSKGEFIDFNGFSSGKVNLAFIAAPGEKKVLNSIVQPDVNGFFSFNYFIPCIDPAGQWKVFVSDDESEKELEFYVNSSVECEYLRVDFINPSSSSYFRTQKFDVRIKITDAGKDVDNAEVYFWDFQGNKKRLYFEANGVYFFEEVEIPIDAEVKQWALMVTAFSPGEEKDGGSNIVSFEIRKVPLQLQLVSPAIKEFNFGKPLDLKIRPVYSDDFSASGIKVWAEFNNQRTELEEISSGLYSVVINTTDLNAEIFYVNVFAEDNYGNTGSSSFDFEPKGYLYFYIAQNAIVYVFPVLFIVYVFFVSFKEGRIFVKRTLLTRKRKKLLILMKKLQEDYFNQQLISREVYNEQFDDYKRQLDQIEQNIFELRQKQEIK